MEKEKLQEVLDKAYRLMSALREECGSYEQELCMEVIRSIRELMK